MALVAFAYFVKGDNSGDTFAVGEVDIMVGNESYYNGILNPNTSWSVTDLTIEKFFNFTNVLPDDYGEDTITLSVELEDTYLCADVLLTSNDDNGCTEPEGLVDGSCGDPGADEGELSGEIQFMWWADDGDNVYEEDETIISSGPVGDLVLGVTSTIALADSDTNIWTGGSGPVTEGSELAISKAWCYGTLAPAPLPQDSDSWTPADDNDNNGFAGQPKDGGFLCFGESLENLTQTDSLTMDVHFNAVQAFGNDGYRCSDGMPPEQVPPILVEDFGEGDCLKDVPGWEEDNGESCVNGTVAKDPQVSGDDTVSPQGGRFGLLSGNNGYLCREVDATGLKDLVLEYYWRGDTDAKDEETGSIHYFTSGTCAAPGALTTLRSHELDDGNNNATEPWSPLQMVNLPGALNNTTFFIRFTADTNAGTASFRLDGLNISGTSI